MLAEVLHTTSTHSSPAEGGSGSYCAGKRGDSRREIAGAGENATAPTIALLLVPPVLRILGGTHGGSIPSILQHGTAQM